jgi:hypothetical protein
MLVYVYIGKIGDQPSSNDVMQIRGRAERKVIENSFQDIFTVRLLYPSNGGYMYPFPSKYMYVHI